MNLNTETMKVNEIIELIDFISKKKLEEVKIETSEIKLSVKKTGGSRVIEQQVFSSHSPMVASAPAPTPVAAPKADVVSAPEAPVVSAADDKYITIKSPMIGTFYSSSDPESPVLANIGDKISVGQTICIIEAMKLFNEIESDVAGTVVKVLVPNASPVEYDQPLFVIDPS